jgi:phospholipase C
LRPAPAVASAGRKGTPTGQDKLSKIDHIVVIYEENHSFDYLYDGWEGVNGRSSAGPTRTTQLSQAGAAYHCLLQTDVNLTSPPQAATCTRARGRARKPGQDRGREQRVPEQAVHDR